MVTLMMLMMMKSFVIVRDNIVEVEFDKQTMIKDVIGPMMMMMIG